MSKSTLITEILRLSRLNPQFDADLSEYRQFLEKKDVEDLEIILHNKKAFMSKSVERNAEREIRKMDRGGMFNIRRMSAANALD